MKPRSKTEHFNSVMPIEVVLYDLFSIDVPAGAGGWKTYCPEGMDHSDGGHAKAMRVYSESNSAWCFSHNRRYDPLSLWILKHGGSGSAAALKAMEHYGISHKAPTPEDRWNRLNELESGESPSSEGIVEALKTFLRTLPDYSTRQYDDAVMVEISSALLEVEAVPSHASYEVFRNTLEGCKDRLRRYWRSRGWL